MKEFVIAVLPGDGIGLEVVPEAVRVLQAIASKSRFTLTIKEAPVGGSAFDLYQSHFPEVTKNVCAESHAVLFGSVGGPVEAAELPKWKNCERNSILAVRKEFSFFANLRSLAVYPELLPLSPLKSESASGVDILVVRELLGDIYFGKHAREGSAPERRAIDVAEYTERQIAAIARVAFGAARKRKKRVSSVDKANVLDTSRLWREVVTEIGREFPDVELEHILVDNCAMQLVRRPTAFDVILCPNLFGDILSDLVSVFGGSLGLMPSASLNEKGFGLYEPAGGSAPDIAGKGIANPIAQILSAALLLRYSFHLENEAKLIERAVHETIKAGYRTRDLIVGSERPSSTREFTDQVIGRL